MTLDLDEFVEKVDALGGPNSPEAHKYWASFNYELQTRVDQNLDPFSEEYLEQQLAVYRELSGRSVDQHQNELTDFALEDHVNAVHPYGNDQSPTEIALHYMRLADVVRSAEIGPGAKALDLGCGWGMTSEFLAQLGCKVIGVDINPQFVELVRRRAVRYNYPIRAIQGNFDTFDIDGAFDVVLFYECFHHVICPWLLVERARSWLGPNGKLILAGEPIQSNWWRNWGLRMDPLSLYCIRKYGWFESGWSKEFLVQMFNRAGYFVEISEGHKPEVGMTVIASLGAKLSGARLQRIPSLDGWFSDGEHLVSTGSSRFEINVPSDPGQIALRINNFRGEVIKLKVNSGKEKLLAVQLQPGENILRIPLNPGTHLLTFQSDTWVPRAQLGTNDDRRMSFNLREICTA